MRIASGKNSRYRRAMRRIGRNIPTTVHLDGKIGEQPVPHGAREAHRQQYQIRFHLEGATWYLLVMRTSVGEQLLLQPDCVYPLHSAVVAGEPRGRDAPL